MFLGWQEMYPLECGVCECVIDALLHIVLQIKNFRSHMSSVTANVTHLHTIVNCAIDVVFICHTPSNGFF